MHRVEKPAIGRVSELPEKLVHTLPDLYFRAWGKENLCPSISEAQKVIAFDPDWTYYLLNNSDKKIVAFINCLPLDTVDPETILAAFPTYRSIEHHSTLRVKPHHIKSLLCFSIVAEGDIKVKRNSEFISPSRFLIESLRTDYHTIPIFVYTRLAPVPSGISIDEYYKKNSKQLNKLGSVGMHAHLGALTPPVAFIHNSRPEDTAGGGANVLMKYPILA